MTDAESNENDIECPWCDTIGCTWTKFEHREMRKYRCDDCGETFWHWR